MYYICKNIKLAGATAALPDSVETIEDLMKHSDPDSTCKVKRIAALAGLKKRHVSPAALYAGELAYRAAKQLIDGLKWDSQSISVFLFATLTPDYLTPPTGSLIAAKLGLSSEAMITDIIDGCPGMTHAAMHACGLLNSRYRRAVIVSGSVYSKAIRPNDIGNAILFGDAMGAIALEYTEDTPPISFNYISFPDEDFAIAHYGTGYRKTEDKSRGLEMKGDIVTDFCRKYVHTCIEKHLDEEHLEICDISNFYFHQPNKMILKGICRDIGIDFTSIPNILSEYANCSGASIPLLLCTKKQQAESGNIICCSFGTGLRVCSMLIRDNSYLPLPPIFI